MDRSGNYGWLWWCLVGWCIMIHWCNDRNVGNPCSSSGGIGVVHGYSMISSLLSKVNNNSGKEKLSRLYPPNNNMAEDVEEYPYSFEGRLWFRPSLVRVEETKKVASVVNCVTVFGWTIGGVVALEYDDSPVGPYKEYVTMGSIVRTPSSIGQWGSNLYVSTKKAEQVCQQIWNVPAQYANIQFTDNNTNNNNQEEQSTLTIIQPPSSNDNNNNSKLDNIQLNGWSQTQICKERTRGGPIKIPIVWTPSIKALWAPFFWSKKNDDNEDNDESQKRLPWHQLRLSAGAIRIVWCPQKQLQETKTLGIPIPFGLAVDNVLIEISPQKGTI